MTNKQMEKKIRQAFQNVTPDRVNAVAARAILSDEQNRKGAEKPMKTVKTSIQFRAIATLAASIAVVILIASALLIRNPDPGPSAQPGDSTPSTESTGTANSTPDNLIGIEAALDAANAHIANTGIPPLDLVNVSWELDEEDGRYYYEIGRWQITPEGGLNVSFVIDAQSGNIVDYKSNATGSDTISQEEAIEIALNHANLTREESLITIECELDDEIPHYDIEIRTNGKEYEYEIRLSDGVILSEKVEADDEIPGNGLPIPPSGIIDRDLAIQNALQSLGITDIELVIKCEEEDDEQEPCYVFSFDYNGFEYKIEVSMYTGIVLSTEKEPIIKDSVIEDGNIGKDLAIKTALDSVGIPDKSLVTNLECDADADEPVAHYDVSFEYEGAEFEIEVGMYNPTVLSTEKEPID